jgi:phosphoglycolate phosphatase-like HAD superfamily hydrolase
MSAQFGSGTVVPADVRLIILDCFETLVEMRERRYVARNGVGRMLDYFVGVRGVPCAVLSDGEQSAVESALEQAGIRTRFAAVVGAPESLGQAPDGRVLKRLDAVIARFAIAERDHVVFVGDSPLDAAAAAHHRVPFIRVPRSEDREFSFAVLLSGPSRYQSAEFTARMLEHYQQKP